MMNLIYYIWDEFVRCFFQPSSWWNLCSEKYNIIGFLSSWWNLPFKQLDASFNGCTHGAQELLSPLFFTGIPHRFMNSSFFTEKFSYTLILFLFMFILHFVTEKNGWKFVFKICRYNICDEFVTFIKKDSVMNFPYIHKKILLLQYPWWI